jgi:glycerophosphoryl diester phosphodiesterase
LFVFLAACKEFTPPQEEQPQKESSAKKPELHGHRGARGLAPENTWPAFEAGILNRMTAIELDISLTADDDFIIHHDTFTNPQLCRRDDGGKIRATPIRRLKVAALKLLDCGSMRNAKFPEQKTAPFTLRNASAAVC